MKKIRTISPQTTPSQVYIVCLVSQPKRKKGKKIFGQIRLRRLTHVQYTEFLVVKLHVHIHGAPCLVQSKGGQGNTKQSARPVHFYWAQGNSQSKHQ